MKEITSAANAKVKLAASLEQRKKREETGFCVAEGIRLCEMAAASDWEIYFGLCTGTALKHDRVKKLVEKLEERGAELYLVSNEIYKKAAATVDPQGILLVVRKTSYELAELDTAGDEPALWVVLDGVQDPGNAGTIIRTADAVGCSGIIFLEGSVDAFSSKTIRSAMGSHFHLPLAVNVKRTDLLQMAGEKKIRLLATALDSSAQPHFSSDYRSACAVVFGNEGNGISIEISQASEHIFIPMRGETESLNVAGAAAVVLYEAMRQRYF